MTSYLTLWVSISYPVRWSWRHAELEISYSREWTQKHQPSINTHVSPHNLFLWKLNNIYYGLPQLIRKSLYKPSKIVMPIHQTLHMLIYSFIEAGCTVLWPRRTIGNNMHYISQELKRKDFKCLQLKKNEQFWGDGHVYPDFYIIQHVHMHWVITWSSYMHNFLCFYMLAKLSNLNAIDIYFPNTELIQHN